MGGRPQPGSTAWRKAYLQAAGVGLEASGGVLCGDAALDGEAVDPDLVLFEAQFGQAPPLTHSQLGVHKVHTGEGGDGEHIVRLMFNVH